MRKPKQRTVSTEKVIAVRHRDEDDDEDVDDDFDVEQNFADSAELDEDDLENMFDGGDEDDDEDKRDEQHDKEEDGSAQPKKKKKKGVPEHMKEGLALYQIKNTDDDENETALEVQTLLASQKPITRADQINEVGLLQRLDDIKLGGGKVEVPWIERLDITSLQPTVIENVNDDLNRELAFYQQALKAALHARNKMEDLGVPHKRPEDYFAEMIKSDAHMSKIRMHMLKQKQGIEEAETRRKNRDMKKFGKQVQREKQQEREKKKKTELATIKKWRKDREKGVGDADLPIDVNNKNDKKNKPTKRRNEKRDYKNSKYGFGGKKKRSKANTKESASDTKSFSLRQNKSLPSDLKDKVKGGGSGGKRPGKRARNARR